ncbi:MAG TPA: molecular chaperone [Dokdonella sp.]
MDAFSNRLLGVVAGLLLGGAAANAADLRVAPVTVEPPAGARTATLTLINDEDRPLKAQIRVMRWTVQDGHDVLTPTTDVAASPPLANLKPKERYLVRIVRTAKTPPAGEESYRVLVDEVPDPSNVKPGTVNLVVRQSIPAFFSDAPQRVAKIDWSLVDDGGKAWLVARNSGNRRLRLADVSLESGGREVYRRPGLVGYVLAGAETRWPIDAALPAGSEIRMKAAADAGTVDVSLGARTGS